jgi:hypothetical protein
MKFLVAEEIIRFLFYFKKDLFYGARNFLVCDAGRITMLVVMKLSNMPVQMVCSVVCISTMIE